MPRPWPGLTGKVDPYPRGDQHEPRERDEEEIARANVRRAKRKVRHMCGDMALTIC